MPTSPPKKNRGMSYTKLYRELSGIVGLDASAVYSEILSYENGHFKSCSASQKTLSKNLGISMYRLKRALNILYTKGYIYAVTDTRGKAVYYCCRDLNSNPVPQEPRQRQLSWAEDHKNIDWDEVNSKIKLAEGQLTDK